MCALRYFLCIQGKDIHDIFRNNLIAQVFVDMVKSTLPIRISVYEVLQLNIEIGLCVCLLQTRL